MISTKLLYFRPKVLPCLRQMSSLAPTFTTTGETSKIISKLSLHNIASMIVSGQPNKAFPSSYEVNIDEFVPGAIGAVSVVTEAMSQQDWDSLSGLVSYECVSQMKKIMESLSPEERNLSVVKQDDVFFSFISNPENCDKGNNLNIVLFYFPKLGENL